MNNSLTFPVSLALTVIALIAVLAIAWMSLKLLAGLGKGSLKHSRMKIVQSLPVGSRERIIIVDVDGQEYVLGVTAQGITRLDSPKSHIGDLDKR